jgi:hypothetical protein
MAADEYAYSATIESGLVPEEVTFVVLAVALPAATAHWIARRRL